MPGWTNALHSLPVIVRDRSYGQYGSGANACKPRRIAGSVMITIDSDQVTPISICHLINDGFSPLIIGHSVARKESMVHTSGKYAQLPNYNAENN